MVHEARSACNPGHGWFAVDEGFELGLEGLFPILHRLLYGLSRTGRSALWSRLHVEGEMRDRQRSEKDVRSRHPTRDHDSTNLRQMRKWR